MVREPNPRLARQFLWLLIIINGILWLTHMPHGWFHLTHLRTFIIGTAIVIVSESWPLQFDQGSISLSSAGYFSVFLVGGLTDTFWVVVIGVMTSWIRRFRGLSSFATVSLLLLSLFVASHLFVLFSSDIVLASVIFALAFLVLNHVIVNLYFFIKDANITLATLTRSALWDIIGWGLSLPLVAIYVLLHLADPRWWVVILGIFPYVTVLLLMTFYYQTLQSQSATRKSAQAAQAITAALDRDSLIESVRQAFSDTMGFSLFALYLQATDSGQLVLASAVHPVTVPYPEIFEVGGEGITDWALATRMPEFIQNADHLLSASPSPEDTHPLKSGFILPLMTDRHIWGFILVGQDRPNAYRSHHYEMAKVISSQTAVAYRKWMLQAEAEQISRQDPLLPGVLNFRYFRQVISDRIADFRDGQSFALAFLDLDNFKRVNDQHGHLKGDEVLIRFSHLVETQLRERDLLARYGGDEFVVLFDQVDEDGANVALHRIQELVELQHWIDVEVKIGVSTGFSLYPRDGETVEALLNHADFGMYQNKVQRKNMWQNASKI